MSWHQMLYATPLLLSALAAAYCFVRIPLGRRRNSEEPWFFACGALWAFAAAMQVGSVNLRTATFWSQVQIVAMTPIPCVLWIYTLRRTGREELITRRNVILLAIVPCAFLLLILTNDAHGLIVRHREMRSIGEYVWIHRTRGPLFIAFIVHFAFYITLACSAIIRRMIISRRRLYRWQPLVVLASFSVFSISGLVQITVVQYYPICSLAFVICIMLLVHAIRPLQRRDVLPVAWKLVAETMEDAVLVLDTERCLVDLNPSACAVIGSSRNEALRRPLGELWPGDREAIEHLLLAGRPARDLVHTLGSNPRTFDLQVSPLRDDRGALASLVLVLRDVSQHHEAEMALHRYREHLEDLVAERTLALQVANRDLQMEIEHLDIAQGQLEQSEERFQTIFVNAPEAYYLSDLKGVFIDGNKAAEDLVGYAKDELIGASFLELHLLTPSQIARAAVLLARNVLGHKTGPDEFLLRRKDGTQVAVEISTHPVRIARQTVVLGTVHDLSERKRAEETLRWAHNELELRVQQRTAELAMTNRELEAQVVERERADEQVRASLTEKEVLLKEIHHRVKNNLQIICSLLSLQAQSTKDRQVLNLFAESEHRVRSMALIHEKLYRSHDLARISFREYAEDLVQYLHRSYSDAWGRIQVRVEADDVLLSVENAVPCGLILNELVNNCFKHAFPGAREGTITVGMHGNGNGHLRLSVEDDGVGMPEGFDLAETTSLGMQIVSTLTEQLGGDLQLASHEGASVSVAFQAQPV